MFLIKFGKTVTHCDTDFPVSGERSIFLQSLRGFRVVLEILGLQRDQTVSSSEFRRSRSVPHTESLRQLLTCPVFVPSVWTVFDGGLASDRDTIMRPEQLNSSTQGGKLDKKKPNLIQICFSFA